MTLSFVLKRIFYSLSVLWGVVTLVFVLFNALPGDPARLTMGQRSDVASLENVRKELNLDKPLLTRYGYYLNDLLPLTVHASDSVSRTKYQYASLLSLGDHYDLVAKNLISAVLTRVKGWFGIFCPIRSPALLCWLQRL
jgi:ABC-type dipeptide/oligopeptide/nickel transport systems, permease components